jgi:hypothetical protein
MQPSHLLPQTPKQILTTNVRYVSCIINFNRIYVKIVKQYAYAKFGSFEI